MCETAVLFWYDNMLESMIVVFLKKTCSKAKQEVPTCRRCSCCNGILLNRSSMSTKGEHLPQVSICCLSSKHFLLSLSSIAPCQISIAVSLASVSVQHYSISTCQTFLFFLKGVPSSTLS